MPHQACYSGGSSKLSMLHTQSDFIGQRMKTLTLDDFTPVLNLSDSVAKCLLCPDGGYIPYGDMTEHMQQKHGGKKLGRQAVRQQKKLDRYLSHTHAISSNTVNPCGCSRCMCRAREVYRLRHNAVTGTLGQGTLLSRASRMRGVRSSMHIYRVYGTQSKSESPFGN